MLNKLLTNIRFKRLLAQEAKVSMWNGNFQKIELEYKTSYSKLVLEISVYTKELTGFHGKKVLPGFSQGFDARLVEWKGCSGVVLGGLQQGLDLKATGYEREYPYDERLKPVVEELVAKHVWDAKERQKVFQDNKNAFGDFKKEMGF